MALAVVWEMPDGSVRVTYPAPRDRRENETEAQQLDRIAARLAAPDAQGNPSEYAAATRLANVDPAALPTRRWRNAWRRVGAVIDVHADTARGLRKAELLAEAETRLARVRAKGQEADEDNDNTKKNALKARAKTLRGLATSLAQLLAGVAVADLAAWVPAEFGVSD